MHEDHRFVRNALSSVAKALRATAERRGFEPVICSKTDPSGRASEHFLIVPSSSSFIVFSSFVLHLDRQRTKRLSASGLGMDIHMLHRHKRPSQGNNLTYLRGMGFAAPLIRTAREIRLIT